MSKRFKRGLWKQFNIPADKTTVHFTLRYLHNIANSFYWDLDIIYGQDNISFIAPCKEISLLYKIKAPTHTKNKTPEQKVY